ncbi:unnamed protein product [Urochloa humidicola]
MERRCEARWQRAASGREGARPRAAKQRNKASMAGQFHRMTYRSNAPKNKKRDTTCTYRKHRRSSMDYLHWRSRQMQESSTCSLVLLSQAVLVALVMVFVVGMLSGFEVMQLES